MIVLIQRTFNDPKTLSKTLTTLKQVNATPFESMNILHPKLILEYDPDINSGNYCYIPEFGKYYFMYITFDTGRRTVLNCDIDPLKTWDNAIRNCKGTILRSESIGAPTQIVDNKLPIDPNRNELLTLPILKNGSQVFAQSIDDCYFVLTNIGNVKQNPIEQAV